MGIYSYTAENLFDSIFNDGDDFLLLDVRNNEDFSKFSVDGPFLKEMLNIPYFEFMEFEEESIKKVPREKKIKIVCAKEGSAKYVADILNGAGFDDIGYLSGGIGSWAELLKPVLIEKSEDFTLYQFIRPGKGSLSYGLICNGELYIFDPARMRQFYFDFAETNHLNITKLFETHLQADYISGSRKIQELSRAQVVANGNDFSIAKFDYYDISDGEEILCKNSKTTVKAIHTPGHTPGSTSYLVDNRYLITGDAVFIKSIGRPDLGGKVDEWSAILFDTIQNKLKKIDRNITILPGHYMEWSELSSKGIFLESLKVIMDNNRDIYNIKSLEEFKKFIKSNMRKQPEVYAEIRKVNAGLLEPSEEDQKIMDVGKNECAASK